MEDWLLEGKNSGTITTVQSTEGTMFLKAVILDCDGVILDSFREGLRRIRLIAAIHEIAFDRQTRSRLTDLWGLPGIELLEQGLGINRAFAERIYKDWEKLDITNPVPLIPGARETLYWLRKNGEENHDGPLMHLYD